MALIKQVVVGMIGIMEDKQMQVREDTVIYEDGVEISRVYNRYVSAPGDDLEGKPQIVKDIANLLWTPEVVTARKQFLHREIEKIKERERLSKEPLIPTVREEQ